MISIRAPKILIVDDDPWQRLGLMELISLGGYESYSVENGRKALEELHKYPREYHLVLMDLIMPELVLDN